MTDSRGEAYSEAVIFLDELAQQPDQKARAQAVMRRFALFRSASAPSDTDPQGTKRLFLGPTPEMIEAGAQRLVRWETGKEKWPEDWSKMDVRAARNDAERCWLSMWLAAPSFGSEPQQGEMPSKPVVWTGGNWIWDKAIQDWRYMPTTEPVAAQPASVRSLGELDADCYMPGELGMPQSEKQQGERAKAPLSEHEIELIRACLDDGTYTRQEQSDIGRLCDMAIAALRTDAGSAKVPDGMGHDEAHARINECFREIEIICDSFGYDPAQWLIIDDGDGPVDAPSSQEQPK